MRDPSGVVTLHANTVRYVSFSDQLGDYHVSSMWPELLFPVTFVDVPSVVASCTSTGGVFAMPEAVSTTKCSFRVIDIGRDPVQKDVRLHVIVRGVEA